MRLPPGAKDRKAAIKSLSGLAVNLSAAWFVLIIIAPNFWPIRGSKEVLLLTEDAFLGMLFLWFSFKMERMLL